MAVSPDIYKTELLKLVKIAEDKIDKTLRDYATRYPLYKPIVIQLRSLDVADTIFDVLIPKYRNVGWTSVVRNTSEVTFDYTVSASELRNLSEGKVTTAEDVKALQSKNGNELHRKIFLAGES